MINRDSLQAVFMRLTPKVAEAVMRKRKEHKCLMNLTRNNSLVIQQRAIFLNYIAGDGRRKFVIPTVETDEDGRQIVVDKISFKYIDQK